MANNVFSVDQKQKRANASTVTFRKTQNVNTPNLPFGQEYKHLEAWPQHSEQPTIPQNFSQETGRPSKYVYYYYIVNGDSIWFGKKDNVRVLWQESNAQSYRTLGYDVRKESNTPYTASGKVVETGGSTGGGSSGNGLSRSEVENIVKSVHGDDINRLYDIHREQEERITQAWEHRKSIESKMENQITDHTTFHTQFTNLGKSLTDLSSALTAHEATHIIPTIPNPFEIPNPMTLIILAGIVGLVLVKK